MREEETMRTRSVIIVAVLAAVASGCGGGKKGATTPSGGATPAAAEQESNGKPADPNGKLVVAYSVDVQRFDPRLAYDAYRRNVDLTLFDQLVTKDYYHPEKPLDIVPGLATDWKISDDGKTYTFNLREGVKFHDGTPFDADAAVFSLRTVIDPRFQYFCAECNAASKGDTKQIKDVRKTGDMQIAIELKKPFGGFLELLSSQAQISAMISPAAIKKYGNDGFNMHPVGTGYMKFVAYKAGEEVAFTRNDDYWQGETLYKDLVLRFIPDPVARANALQSGDVNLAYDVAPSYMTAWAKRSDIRPVEAKYPRQYGCQLNYQGGGPTTKREVREAMSLSANRDAMNQAVYAGRSGPAKGFWVEGVPTYDASMPALAYDPAKAKQLLQQAGYANGLKLRVQVGSTGADDPKILAIWQDELRKVGIDLQIKTVDRPTWVSDWLKGLAPSPKGMDGVCWEYGSDLLWNIANYAGSYGTTPPAVYNTGRYDNPAVESALQRAFDAKDLDSYYAALKEANQQLGEDFGMVWTIGNLAIYGLRSDVSWTPARAIQSLWYDAVVHQS
jgi:peptide/nickel transport system substrate-binding protein